MRASLVLLLCILVFNTGIDWIIYHLTGRRCRKRPQLQRLQLWTAVILALLLIVAIILPARQGNDTVLRGKMWLLYSYITFYIPKYIALIFDLFAAIPCLLFKRKRSKIVTAIGLVTATIAFIALWWGALVNRFKIEEKQVDIEIENLPPTFNGYRIAQFSDLHTGTFGSDTTFVSKLIDRINALDADMIVFTGDIVNRHSAELRPFVSILSRLHAPDGVYAILGNHDYGDYMNWTSPQEKRENMKLLYDAYRRTGIKLLRNETVWIRHDNDSIALIGVENIGDPPFPIYGSLSQAYPHLDDTAVKILLTHNPAHWNDSISGNTDINIPLSLSGHTHAMQIEIAGISPATLRYPTWGGLYSDNDKHHSLYVNIGTGTVGMPMRIGATPEITLITLRNKRP